MHVEVGHEGGHARGIVKCCACGLLQEVDLLAWLQERDQQSRGAAVGSPKPAGLLAPDTAGIAPKRQEAAEVHPFRGPPFEKKHSTSCVPQHAGSGDPRFSCRRQTIWFQSLRHTGHKPDGVSADM